MQNVEHATFAGSGYALGWMAAGMMVDAAIIWGLIELGKSLSNMSAGFNPE